MNGPRVDRFILSVVRSLDDNLFALGREILQGERVSSLISQVEAKRVPRERNTGGDVQ
jgi:hypothetical protein